MGADIEAWFAAIAEPRRSTLRAVHDLVREAAPELVPTVEGKAIGYGPFHYRYESGREGDTYRIALANNAQYVSLYVLGEGSKGGYLAEEHVGKLGKASVGKSCIRFKKTDDLDLEALSAVVKEAARQHR